MDGRLLIVAASAIALLASSVAADRLTSDPIAVGPSLPAVDSRETCCMQNGFVVTQGVGCSNNTGTSGGPNDLAERMTLCVPPPYVVVNTFSYIVVTPGVAGFATAASFAVYRNSGGVPGGTACLGPPVPFLTAGTYSIPITSCTLTPAMTSGGVGFFGLKQGGVGGMRWGFENGAAANGAFIRAPACGAPEFAPLSALGSPGSWVFRICIEALVPIDVEEFSWSEVKASYR